MNIKQAIEMVEKMGYTVKKNRNRTIWTMWRASVTACISGSRS